MFSWFPHNMLNTRIVEAPTCVEMWMYVFFSHARNIRHGTHKCHTISTMFNTFTKPLPNEIHYILCGALNVSPLCSYISNAISFDFIWFVLIPKRQRAFPPFTSWLVHINTVKWNEQERKKTHASFYNSFNGFILQKNFPFSSNIFLYDFRFALIFSTLIRSVFHFFRYFSLLLSIRVLRCRLIGFYCMRLVTLSRRLLIFVAVQFHLLAFSLYYYAAIDSQFIEKFSVSFQQNWMAAKTIAKDSQIFWQDDESEGKKCAYTCIWKGRGNYVNFVICHG